MDIIRSIRAIMYKVVINRKAACIEFIFFLASSGEIK